MGNIYITPAARPASEAIRALILRYQESSDEMSAAFQKINDAEGTYQGAIDRWKQSNAASRQALTDAINQITTIVNENIDNQMAIDRTAGDALGM